jgi:hypothetical protein
VPYTKELDDQIPVGTVLPTVLITGEYTDDRAQVRGQARWRDGHWTLVTSRPLATGSKYDIDFKAGEQLYAYVAVYDHNQTRHTRHMRPIELHVR